jgi:hypothetical protein
MPSIYSCCFLKIFRHLWPPGYIVCLCRKEFPMLVDYVLWWLELSEMMGGV